MAHFERIKKRPIVQKLFEYGSIDGARHPVDILMRDEVMSHAERRPGGGSSLAVASLAIPWSCATFPLWNGLGAKPT
jgi:hypothetical protein